MRIITGSARGAKLSTLEGEDVRPTTDRVKQALFNIVQFQIEGRNVLDLFAGSGQLGLEAASRGAKCVVLVDSAQDAIDVISANVHHTNLTSKVKVVHADYASYLMKQDMLFDLAFLDPPYHKGILEKALPLTAKVMNEGGIIVCEYAAGEPIPEEAGDFVKRRTYQYGKIMLTVYEHRNMVAE
ncbi:MAG: 16S rRNA (guanine(966)-N(2))-methyltransferase RsmD [Acutalibacteraceae bacterium]|nr:16S rRNA (guanine(966)-N(2))-methyltransferase RsmD [Acutalibacteraceae bacterium]